MKSLYILLLLLNISVCCFSQSSSCYSRYLLAGIEAYERLDFQKAQNQFKAAIICEYTNQEEKQEAVEWLEKANNGYLLTITNARDSLRRAIGDLEEEKKRAFFLAKQSEANRLALLSENERKNDNNKAALYLAYKALEIAEQAQKPEHQLSFGDAVSIHLRAPLVKTAQEYESLYLSKNKQEIIGQVNEKEIQVVDLVNNSTTSFTPYPDARISYSTVSKNDQQILTTSGDFSAIIWDKQGDTIAHLKGHQEPITYAAFSPNNRLVLTCSRDNTAKIWTMQGDLIATLEGHQGNVYKGLFSKDGTKILTRASDGTVKIWNNEGSALGTLQKDNTYFTAAIFSPNGKQILTPSAAGTTFLWSLDGKLLSRFEEKEALTKNAIFSHDGKQIITTGIDHNLNIWDLNGKKIALLKGHFNDLNSLEFSPDRQYILTASKDRTAILWNNRGDRLQTLIGHRKSIIQAIFSPNGQFILTTSKDSFAKLWTTKGQLRMNIQLKSSTPLPAIFSEDSAYIYAIIDNRLSKIPIPDQALQELQQPNFFSPEELATFKTDFDIQDFDLLDK